jgi:hypothetical protein
MLKEFRATRLDKFTRGVPNTELKPEERTPGYYVYAESWEAATSQMMSRFPGEQFDVVETGQPAPALVFEQRPGQSQGVAA